MNKHMISIVIPVKNASFELQRCLNSIEKQPYRPIEVIINDDQNSPSDSNKNLAKKFNKGSLHIIYLTKNKSMAQGRHSGFLASSGNYVLHLDADMTLSKNVINDLIKGSASFDAAIVPEKSIAHNFWGRARALERSCYVGDENIEAARFFKKDVYKKAGYHDDKLVFSEDKDIDLRVRKAGYKVGRIKSFIYHNEGNITLISRAKKRFFYGRSGFLYVKKQPKHAIMQANVIFRPAYFRNWKELAKHPLLTFGMFILRFTELTAFVAGMFYNRFLENKSIKK